MDFKKIVLVAFGTFAVIILGMAFMFGSIANQIKLQNLPYCSVDVWHLTDSYIIDKGLKEGVKNKKKFIETLTTKIKKEVQNPYQYGCKAIFMKGAVLSNSKDITETIRKKLIQQ